MNHTEARAHIIEGFRRTFGRDPTTSEAQFAQAVGYLESRYGRAWKSAGIGSNNWGAIQSGRLPCDPASEFQYTDSTPNADGSSTPYHICFRRYATPADGAADLIRVMYKRRPTVLAAATAGDAYGVSAAMYDTTYYQGFGSTREKRIAGHHKAIGLILNEVARALGEELPGGAGDPPPPTVKRGARGEVVKDLQRALNTLFDADLVADGAFGPLTERAVRAAQTALKLNPDGVVGPLTWAALEAALA